MASAIAFAHEDGAVRGRGHGVDEEGDVLFMGDATDEERDRALGGWRR